ncbi:MAG TPA: hypothetical protein VFR70_04775, partial [Flavobacterium sp.]|nr:hypothetical protein [Flavobacterium sp.]
GGKIFNNVELLAKDSLFIFIETTIDYNEFAGPEAQFLYTDQIQFDAGPNLQTVELVTLVKDAYFIYPNRINGVYEAVDFGQNESGATTQVRGRTLSENHPANGNEFIWNKTKPYVVYGYASVPASKTLEVQPGARIHFHADSGIIVQNGGTLKINGEPSAAGTLDKEVIFQGDRLEPSFSDTPGQWGFIYLRQGSTNHVVKNLTLKNATIGFLLFGNTGLANPVADLRLENVQIYNSANAGILSQGGYVSGQNVVVNLAGSASFYASFGGRYDFKHCTFNNDWSGRKYAVAIDNYIGQQTYPLAASFSNCIIFSANTQGLLLDKKEGSADFNASFLKCQIKFDNSLSTASNIYSFINDPANIIRNGNVNFLNANKNKLMIGENSSSNGQGNTLISSQVPNDIIGMPRSTSAPDIGAYESIVFPD